jgi:hypothetical protein
LIYPKKSWKIGKSGKLKLEKWKSKSGKWKNWKRKNGKKWKSGTWKPYKRGQNIRYVYF